MHTGSSKVVEALAALGVTGLPILRPSHSFSLNQYPTFLEHVALLVRGVKESMSKATPRAGEKAARQVAIQFVAALHQRCLRLSLLSELEGVMPETSSDPEVTRQVDEIMERLTREDDQ